MNSEESKVRGRSNGSGFGFGDPGISRGAGRGDTGLEVGRLGPKSPHIFALRGWIWSEGDGRS